MRVKVVRAFSDKYTDEFNTVGCELTVSNDRCAELLEAEVVEVIPETTKDEKPKKSKKA